jgi:hypothetical protein
MYYVSRLTLITACRHTATDTDTLKLQTRGVLYVLMCVLLLRLKLY